MQNAPYYVSFDAATPDEKGPGYFFWDDAAERTFGPFSTIGEARCAQRNQLIREAAKRRDQRFDEQTASHSAFGAL